MMSGSSSNAMINLTMRVVNNTKVLNQKMSVQRLVNGGQGRAGTRSSPCATVTAVTINPLSDHYNCNGVPVNGVDENTVNTSTQRRRFSSCLRTITDSGHSHPLQLQRSVRNFTAGKPVLMGEEELRNRLDEFQDLFVEARMCIEDARDSADTTYFDEEAELAKDAVDEAMAAFDGLVADLDDMDQKNSVLRSNGLKAEQLKGELQLVLTGGH